MPLKASAAVARPRRSELLHVEANSGSAEKVLYKQVCEETVVPLDSCSVPPDGPVVAERIDRSCIC